MDLGLRILKERVRIQKLTWLGFKTSENKGNLEANSSWKILDSNRFWEFKANLLGYVVAIWQSMAVVMVLISKEKGLI